MSENLDVDVQVDSILTGLTQLRELLDEPLTKHALDLTNNAKTAKHYDTLCRLQKSLTQYSKRDGDLFYIGILGHFSSGKSSSINSILNIWGTDAEREIGLNPTDTTITLITRDSNSKALLGVIREGLVTIRFQAIDTPFLDNIVIADTPGTGDPHLVEEIARDFLPICDVILFFFSAASPLDQADMPLLGELHKRLPFIPIRFIVTRADELRRDDSEPVSEKNIDASKQSKFLNEVISRVNKLLKPAIYTAESFILIDNKQQYNIEAIVELIKTKCDPKNPQSRVLMHGHKVKYFSSSAKELRSFFEDFLKNKLKELTKIVVSAEQNIRRYNENVRISNNNLTKDWFDQLTSIRAEQDRVSLAVPILSLPPENLDEIQWIARQVNEFDREFMEEIRRTALLLSNAIRNELTTKIRNQISDVREKTLSNIVSNELAASEFCFTGIQVSIDTSVPLLPYNLASRWANLREARASALRELTATLRKALDDAADLIGTRSPWTLFEEIVIRAQTSLSQDLEKFFSMAELYRTGVFSHTTKESISALGLGKELDDLESEFSDTDKTSFDIDAKEGLFPDFKESSNHFLTDIVAVDARLRPLKAAADEVKVPSPQISSQYFTPRLEEVRSSLRNSMNSELRDDIEHFLRGLEANLSGAIVTRRKEYEREISSARRNRWIKYALITGGTAILTLLSYAAYIYFTADVPQNVFYAIFLNVVASFIASGIAFLVVKFLDNFPKASRKIQRDFRSLLRQDMEKITDLQLKNYEFPSIEQGTFVRRLMSAYQSLMDIDPDGWVRVASERLKTLQERQDEYSRTRNEYMDLIHNASGSISSYFNDATKNLQIINAVSDRIKARAIQPSFEFLEKTRQSLENIKKQIHAVEF